MSFSTEGLCLYRMERCKHKFELIHQGYFQLKDAFCQSLVIQ